MRYVVTPEFSEKVSSLPPDGVVAVTHITSFVTSATKDSFASGADSVSVRNITSDIYVLKQGRYTIYATLGEDADGQYVLFLDISGDLPAARPAAPAFYATKNPRTDPRLDPNRNFAIDPRRNMMIDPNRNMAIDPHRNMMIDPRRSMMIDPNRNMMVDPHRNMMIDPRRNMMIDPKRNLMIDPRRNRFYGGPYLYNLALVQEGFVVRANDSVSLVFDAASTFTHFAIATNGGNENVFDTSKRWTGYWIPAEDVRLRFDTANRWIGIVV